MNRKRDEHSLGILGRVYWKKKKKVWKNKKWEFFQNFFFCSLVQFQIVGWYRFIGFCSRFQCWIPFRNLNLNGLGLFLGLFLGHKSEFAHNPEQGLHPRARDVLVEIQSLRGRDTRGYQRIELGAEGENWGSQKNDKKIGFENFFFFFVCVVYLSFSFFFRIFSSPFFPPLSLSTRLILYHKYNPILAQNPQVASLYPQ